MSNRDLMRINCMAIDANLFTEGLDKSAYQYESWMVWTDWVRDRKRVLVTSNINYDSEVTFSPEKVGVVLEDVSLNLNFGAVVPAGVGTYARFCDYAGLAAISNVTVSYSQNTLQRYDSHALFMKCLRDSCWKDGILYSQQLGGELTPAQRNTLAASPQTFKLYLKPFWWKLTSHLVTISALSQKLNLTIRLATPADFLQTDYTNNATVPLNSIEFVYDVINFTGAEREQRNKLTKTTRGLTYLYEDTHTIKNLNFPAGQAEYSVKIEGLNLPFTAVYGLFQPTADLTTAYQKKLFEPSLSDINLISEAYLRDGASETHISPKAVGGAKDFADIYNKFHLYSKYKKPILFFPIGFAVDLKNANTGSLNAQNINNLTLNLKFTQPLPANYTATLIFFEHNFMNFQGGEIQRIFG